MKPLMIPGWLAALWLRAVCWVLVARCWVLGGDWRGLRVALNQSLVLALKYRRMPR